MYGMASIRSRIGENLEDRYLFKAKRKDNGEWVEGFYFCMTHTDGRHTHHFIIPLGADLSLGTPVEKIQVEVDQSTICQCTGLKDKNGRVIWENDIVAYWDSYSTESGLAEADCIGKVVWDDETISFQVTNRLSAESYEVLGDECSVIGNVFDNPELLEE